MKKLVLATLLILGIGIYLTCISKPVDNVVVETEEISDNVTYWLQSFLNKDYDTCDLYAESDSQRLFPNNTGASSSDYYLYLMDKLSDCIVSSNVCEPTNGVYEIEITLKSYELLDDITVDEATLKDLKVRYINEEITIEEFKSALQSLYWDSYQASFKLDESGVTSKVLLLSERTLDGKTYIYGVSDFIDELLVVSNLKYNVEFFENNIQQKIDDMLLNI